MKKRLRIHVEGKSYEVEVELLDTSPSTAASAPPAGVSSASVSPAAASPSSPPAASPKTAASENCLVSPLAGIVVSLHAKAGDSVNEGDKVVTLEAMKMNTVVTATKSGTIKTILVETNDAVEEGQALIEFA